ncbi:hypothetical protein WISP_115598 [Willisornis vidua]|uniref:Uncharacterized protein n=1 Tax=Willisornis vidua TaxID=1566151 RepID=A0ABQ9CUA8_9PASS|nr:hypothetical protein WISP_115598 [Willisornis vidua]
MSSRFLCDNAVSILDPVFFNIFINDLDTELEGIRSKFADDPILGETAVSLEGREALQRDLDQSERQQGEVPDSPSQIGQTDCGN